MLSYVFIIGGFFLLSAAWRVLFRSQQNHELAITGPYARLRHPQYTAFIMIMLGFLFQWPTLPTLGMFPILVWVYVRLARREEKETLRAFGERYACYAAKMPRFFPRLWGNRLSQKPIAGGENTIDKKCTVGSRNFSDHLVFHSHSETGSGGKL